MKITALIIIWASLRFSRAVIFWSFPALVRKDDRLWACLLTDSSLILRPACLDVIFATSFPSVQSMNKRFRICILKISLDIQRKIFYNQLCCSMAKQSLVAYHHILQISNNQSKATAAPADGIILTIEFGV